MNVQIRRYMNIVPIFIFIIFTFFSYQNSLTQDNWNRIVFEPYPIRCFSTDINFTDFESSDFNLDGYPDIVVATPEGITILVNETDNANINFSVPFSTDFKGSCYELVSTDFNGDGKIDIALFSKGLIILENKTENNTILFNQSKIEMNTSPNDLLAADLDGDGKEDLIFADSYNDTLVIFKNTSSLDSIEFEVEERIHIDILDTYRSSITIDDYDGDGKRDIASLATTAFYLLRNSSSDGNIHFKPPQKIAFWGLGEESCSGDFNADGKIDLCLLEAGDHPQKISFLENTSIPGKFEFKHRWNERISTEGIAQIKIYTCDINCDNKIDIICPNNFVLNADSYHNHVSILLNKGGSFNFKSAMLFGAIDDPRLININDFDRDGKIDLAVANNLHGLISIFHNQSTPDQIRLSSIHSININQTPGFVLGADFDGNNTIDLVSANWRNNTISVICNSSSRNYFNFQKQGEYLTSQNPEQIFASDFNNDGKIDIAVANRFRAVLDNRPNAAITLFQNVSNQDTLMFSRDSIVVGEKQLSIDGADFNGDNKIDLVVGVEHANISDSLIILENISSSDKVIFKKALSLVPANRPQSIITSDFDSDGQIDIGVGQNFISEITIFRNKTTTSNYSFVHAATIKISNNCIVSGDLDGDEKPDIVGIDWGWHGGYGSCYVIRNTSLPDSINFTEPLRLETFRNPRLTSVVLKDVIGDGLLDIIIQEQYCRLLILENQSRVGSFKFSGNNQGEIILGDGNIIIEDLDMDGFQEIISPRSDLEEVYFIRTFFKTKPTIANFQNKLPYQFILYHNYPNPFNMSTTIRFDVPQKSKTQIRIFNILGQEIKTLANRIYSPGSYELIWNGYDNLGRPVPSGLYIYSLQANNLVSTHKCLLLK